MGSIASSSWARIFRAPGNSLPIDTLLQRAWPEAALSERQALIDRQAIRIAGRPVRALRTRVPAGAQVEIDSALGQPKDPAPHGKRDAEALHCQVLVPSLPWPAGVLARRRDMGAAVSYERLEVRGGIDRLLLGRALAGSGEAAAAQGLVADARRVLGASGHPVLGDTLHGGILVAGGLRLSTGPEPPEWPDEAIFPGATSGTTPGPGPGPGAGSGKAGSDPVLRVSRATARIVGRGHPWILRDDDTDDTSCFAPGTRVRVEGPDGEALGIACVEGSGRLTARMWSEAGRQDSGPSVEARVARALEQRAALIHPAPGEQPGQQPSRAATDVFRLVHGEADGLPGLFVDRLAGVLRVLVTGPGSGSYRERALDALVSQLRPSLGSDPPVIEVLHLRDRPPGEHRCTVLARGARAYEETCEETSEEASEETTRMPVRERGVVFLVDPGLASPGRSSPGFGLYPDQRENRARLVSRARGGRLLNLFAHTGAFSVAWLAGGGGEAVSVDLSGAYLRWLDENLAANGIDPTRHRGVRQDGRRFVETLDRGERFDAIVVDPPTAASAGRRFWSVSRDLPVLVERLLGHLAPGGRLLVSRNDRRRGALRSLVEQAARRAHLDLQSIEPAPPGRDFPRRRGFPEGDPFAAVLVTRS